MLLAELSLLVGTSPKWVLNASAVISMPRRYTIDLALRLAVARALQDATGATLPHAYATAGEVLSRYRGDKVPVVLPGKSEAVQVRVDVYRIMSEVNVRRSQLATMHTPRRRGPRRARRRDPLRAAAEYGIDVSLLRANLARTPAQRLGQLDNMMAFRQGVRRQPSA